MKKTIYFFLLIVVLLLVVSCAGDPKNESISVYLPIFNNDTSLSMNSRALMPVTNNDTAGLLFIPSALSSFEKGKTQLTVGETKELMIYGEKLPLTVSKKGDVVVLSGISEENNVRVRIEYNSDNTFNYQEAMLCIQAEKYLMIKEMNNIPLDETIKGSLYCYILLGSEENLDIGWFRQLVLIDSEYSISVVRQFGINDNNYDLPLNLSLDEDNLSNIKVECEKTNMFDLGEPGFYQATWRHDSQYYFHATPSGASYSDIVAYITENLTDKWDLTI